MHRPDEQVEGKATDDQLWIGQESMGSDQLSARFGHQATDNIVNFLSSWQKNYRRAAFIDTGLPGSAASGRHARALAQKYQWEFAAIKGDTRLLTALLTAESSTAELLVVPPGYVTLHDGISNQLAAAPAGGAGAARYCPRRFTLGSARQNNLQLRYGLGIDAGGTYTDVVIHDFSTGRVVAKHKALTTRHQFSLGISTALSGLPQELLARAELVAVSTTLATNAIVENEGQPTGLLVMAGTQPVKELFPHRPTAFLSGRLNMDGQEIEPLDSRQIRAIGRRMVQQERVSAFAVSGFAGAINPRHELEAQR